MKLRLGFAVAAHLEPDILVVDEVLAVGDAAFQKKCLGKMNQVAGEGRTVLFVSHNIGAIVGLSTSGLLLDEGRIATSGNIHQVVEEYLEVNDSTEGILDRTINGDAYFESIQFSGPSSIDAGENLDLAIHIHSRQQTRLHVTINWHLVDELGIPVGLGNYAIQHGQTLALVPGNNVLNMQIGPLLLAEGRYSMSFELNIPRRKGLDRLEDCLSFTIRSCTLALGTHSIQSAWRKGCVVLPFEIDVST
jgi:lipopolysaccharide transport system ATP-binding protein